MKRRSLIFLLVVVALAVVIWRPWRARFGYHFEFPLPQSATLVNYHHSSGRDSGDEFEFKVTDDALRDAIINEWSLKPASGDDDARSFAIYTGAPWWPRATLKALPERYFRVDEVGTQYWSLWVDRANGKLYAEYGDW